MMKKTVQNRFERVFAQDKKLLAIYYTAGFPTLNDTLPILRQLEAEGVDIIELGMPYSDPLADGPIIQESGAQAIQNGMTLQKLFVQLETLRPTSRVPVVLMGYWNTVLQYGVEAFCARCAAVGVDGVILPDLPLEYFQARYQPYFVQHGLAFIPLITPETPSARILIMDKLETAFLYAVSSSTTTGANADIQAAATYLQRLKNMQLKTPILTGFSIKTSTDFQQAAQHTRGGIIGSAFIRALQQKQPLKQSISSFIQTIRS